MLLLLLQALNGPVIPPPPGPVASMDIWGGAWSLSWGNSWGVISVEPPVREEPIFYPGACFPFGGGGKIRPHRTRRQREADHLLLMH